MGLDMHLYGTKWLMPFADDCEKDSGFPVVQKKLLLGYWRKHPNLHVFISNHFSTGIDESTKIQLEKKDLLSIITAVESEKLPTVTGKYLGSSSGEEQTRDLEILKKALAWLEYSKDDGSIRTVVYEARW